MTSTDGRPSVEHVYYASYGSNLHRDRLLAYVVGGTVDGAAGCQFGCSDKTVPTHSFVALAPGCLRFGRTSRKWGGGGVCFLETKTAASSTGRSAISAPTSPDPSSELLVRAWRMSGRQFLDIFLQENSLNPATDGHKATDAHLETLLASGLASGLAVGRGWYSYMWYIGDAPDGLPVVTCTAHPDSWSDPAVKDDLKHNPPSLAYARVILKGLKECGLDDAAAVRYLSDRAQIELDTAALAADAAALAAALPVEKATADSHGASTGTGDAAGSAGGSRGERMAVDGTAEVLVPAASGGAGAAAVAVSTATGSSASFPPFVQLTFKR